MFEPPVWSLHVLLVPAWVFSGDSGFLPQSKDMQVGDSKLPVGVSVSGCLSLCVSPATDWQPVQGVPRHSPNDSWAPATPATLLRISGIEND